MDELRKIPDHYEYEDLSYEGTLAIMHAKFSAYMKMSMELSLNIIIRWWNEDLKDFEVKRPREIKYLGVTLDPRLT